MDKWSPLNEFLRNYQKSCIKKQSQKSESNFESISLQTHNSNTNRQRIMHSPRKPFFKKENSRFRFSILTIFSLLISQQKFPFCGQQPTWICKRQHTVILLWHSKKPCLKQGVLAHTFPWAEHGWGPPFQAHSDSTMRRSGRKGHFGLSAASLGNATLPFSSLPSLSFCPVPDPCWQQEGFRGLVLFLHMGPPLQQPTNGLVFGPQNILVMVPSRHCIIHYWSDYQVYPRVRTEFSISLGSQFFFYPEVDDMLNYGYLLLD